MARINTITDVLQAVHRTYEGDTNYPSAGSEDFIIRLEYANDGIGIWESEALEGDVTWPSLITSAVVSAGGSGSDALPSDFLATYRVDAQRSAQCTAGDTTYREVDPSVGEFRKREGITEPVFWIAGGTIHTYPAASSDITLPYMRTATRYAAGTESTPLDMADGYYLVYYVLAQLAMTDRDTAKMDYYLGRAEDVMSKMNLAAISGNADGEGFAFGT